MDDPSTRRALSVAEACKQLSLSRAFIYVLIKKGRLRTVKIGGRRLIPTSEIERLLNEGCRAA